MIFPLTQSLLNWKIEQATLYKTNYITYGSHKIPLKLVTNIRDQISQALEKVEGMNSASLYEADLPVNT